jgi:carbamoyltransferase
MNVIGISGLDNAVRFKKREFPRLSSRHYRIAQGFDSAAALVTRLGIQAAAAEERFNGEKGTGAFPINAIRYCLEACDTRPAEIDYIAHGFSFDPFKSFYEHDEFIKKQFAEVYCGEVQRRCIQKYLPGYDWTEKLVPVLHHLAHAASVFYLSGFDESLILVADGMGEVQSTTIAIGKGKEIHTIKQVNGLHSLGILYGVFTLYLGFYMGLDEYKVMGLAPHGNARRYFERLMGLVHLKRDGTYEIPVLFQNRSWEEKETYAGTLDKLTSIFGPPRKPEAEITPNHLDIAAALQATLQASLLHILRHFKRETGQKNLCMAGGVALNCTANGTILRSRMFKRMFVQPASGDDGTAVGAALYVQRLRDPTSSFEKMTLPVWGPEYHDEVFSEVLSGCEHCTSVHFDSLDDLIAHVARGLADGQIVGWFQGRMEFGPRALGCRSILADPRDPAMRDRINRLVKKREEFRPFAPAVTVEAAARFFDIREGEESTYAHMLFVTRVRAAYHNQLPAITHVDGSARVQTVAKKDQPRFWALLVEFGKISGMPILLNTSFNVRGQPIVRTPKEAVDTFLSAQLDMLVMGNYLIKPLARARAAILPRYETTSGSV